MQDVGAIVALVAVVVFTWGLVSLLKPRLMFGARTRKQVLLAMLGSFALFLVGGGIISTSGKDKKAAAESAAPAASLASSTTTRQPAGKPAQPAPTSLPDDEAKFVAAVVDAQRAYRSAANEMAAGGVRTDRRKSICVALPKLLAVRDWIGTITTLSTSNDGRGVLEVEIAKGVKVGTTNNSFSNSEWPTLIEVGSDVFKSAVAMKKGDKVKFGGEFKADPADCVKEASLTLDGSMKEPLFLFRFRDVRAP